MVRISRSIVGACKARTGEPVIRIERPVLVNPAVNTGTQHPVRTVIDRAGGGRPEEIVAVHIDPHYILQMVVDLGTYLTALQVVVEIVEITCLHRYIQRREDHSVGGGGDIHILIHHIGITAVDLNQEVAVRAYMQSQLSVHRRVLRAMRLDDTRVDNTVAVLLHVTLQCSQAVEAHYVGIDGEPLFDHLRLEIDVRRGRKREVLYAAEAVLAMADVQIEVHAHVYAHAPSFIFIVRLDTEIMPAAVHRVGNRCGEGPELEEVVLYVQFGARMVLLRMPVERRMGTDLVLAHGTGFGEELVTRLHLVLEVLLGVRLYAHEDLCCPERGLVQVRQRRTVGVSRPVLLPHAEIAVRGSESGVVVEMAVLIVMHVTSLHTEIEVAGGEGVCEPESQTALAQRSQAPFGAVVRIDIEDRFLAVIEVVAEIEEGVGVAQRPADITVVDLPGLETRRLGEQRVEGSRRLHIRRIFGVHHGCGLNRRLYNSRFGGHFACRLDDGLEVALHHHRAVQRRIRLRHGVWN